MARKRALIIGNTEYKDARLSGLVSPQSDVMALADVLRSTDIGQFDEVRTLINETAGGAREELWRFFAGDTQRDDLLLFYFSGHGVKDDHGDLHLACSDTDMNLLHARALPASEVSKAMDRSRSRRQVVILDCCHSGAFEHGAKAVMGESVGTKGLFGDTAAFQAEGQGRITLTATDATQFAWEGSNLTGDADRSVFTECLVEGLRTGKADQNGDGYVGVDELYDYVYSSVVNRTPRQQPKKFGSVQGEFVIARRPAGTEEPVPLPPEIEDDMSSVHRSARLEAVAFLTDWLRGHHVGRVLAARKALRAMANEDDSVAVRQAADAALEAQPDAGQPVHEPSERMIVIPAGRRPAEPRSRAEPDAGDPAVAALDAANREAARARRRREWTAWAQGEFAGDPARVQASADAAVAAEERGADGTAAAAAARRAVAALDAANREAAEARRREWTAWAQGEFSGDPTRERAAADAAVAAAERGADGTAAAAAARQAVAALDAANREAAEARRREWTAWAQRHFPGDRQRAAVAIEAALAALSRGGDAAAAAVAAGDAAAAVGRPGAPPVLPALASKAQWALALGIVCALFFWLYFPVVLGPVAAWLGSAALSEIRRSGGRLRGTGVATWGIVLGLVGAGGSALFIIVVIAVTLGSH